MEKKRITIKDVAWEVGLDASTVSRALNNKERVNETTRGKVLEVAKKLGYHPNIMARGLVLKKTETIGFIIDKSQSDSLSHGFFYGMIMEGIEEEIRKYGYHLIFSTINNSSKRKSDFLKIIREDRTDGLILAGCKIDKKIILAIKKKKIPLVLVDNHFDQEKINCVVTDNINGAYEAVSHLIRLGYKKISFFTNSLNNLSFSERFEGYKLALKQHGLDCNERLVQKNIVNSGEGCISLKELLDNAVLPMAIFAANDVWATEAMKMIKEKKLKIPQDIAIVGFDDEKYASYTDPPLTTVRVFKKEMGQMAGRRLIEIINNKNSPPVKYLISTQLIVRESCGAKKVGI